MEVWVEVAVAEGLVATMVADSVWAPIWDWKAWTAIVGFGAATAAGSKSSENSSENSLPLV
jgi:hypothetical protein